MRSDDRNTQSELDVDIARNGPGFRLRHSGHNKEQCLKQAKTHCVFNQKKGYKSPSSAKLM